jgi:hypothetical protein
MKEERMNGMMMVLFSFMVVTLRRDASSFGGGCKVEGI